MDSVSAFKRNLIARLKDPRSEVPLVVLAALLWVPGMGGPSFLSDDFDHLLTWGTPPFDQIWRWFYTESFGYYRPLTALLWKVEYALWGSTPLGFQLVNLGLHTGCALLVRRLALQVFGSSRSGLWAALTFLFLPGHIFGVLMVAALTGLLCALLYLASISFYLQGRSGSRSHLALSVAFFLLAALTKELALSLPLLVCLWEAIALRDERRLSFVRWFKSCLPYGLALAAYLLFRLIHFGQLPHSPLHAHLDPLRIAITAATYASKCFAPWGLEGLKPFFRAHPDLLALVAGAGLLAVLSFGWTNRHAIKPGHWFSVFWLGITMLPVVTLYSPWNTYLTSVAAALLIGVWCDWSAGARAAGIRKWGLATFLSLSVIYSLDHQQRWRHARVLCSQLTEALVAMPESDTYYLANLPAEWSDVPLFVGDSALRGAVALAGHRRQVVGLANVCKVQRADRVKITRIDGSTFSLRLTLPQEFIRLESLEIIASRSRREPGYTYSKGAATIRVEALNPQGQVHALTVDMGSHAAMSRVYLWDGNQLMPLFKP